MAEIKTSLSVGEIIRGILVSDEAVKAITERVFPVLTQTKAELPYLVYQRTNLTARSVKEHRSSDEVEMEIMCFAERYEDSVKLAEAVREALDGCQAECGKLFMSKCILTGASESYAADAYIQCLIFNIKVQ